MDELAELQAALAELGFTERMMVIGRRGNEILYEAVDGHPIMDAPSAFVEDGKVVLGDPYHIRFLSNPDRFVGDAGHFRVYKDIDDAEPTGHIAWRSDDTDRAVEHQPPTRTSVDTPVGEVSWVGHLSPYSDITLPSGGIVNMQSWIGRTNGDCLEWLADYL